MSTEPRNVPNPGFEVEIKSGGRAYDENAPTPQPRTVSPTRAAAKAHRRRLYWTISAVVVVLLGAVGLWAWISNPNTNVPADAVARVNGEYIYEHDIDRELDLTRMTNELSNASNSNLPSRAQVLEDLISRKMQVQDAKKAGVDVSKAEVDNAMKGILDRTGLNEQQLEAALAKHNLKIDDMRLVTGDVLLVNKYIGQYVVQGATSDTDIQNKKNDWLTSLTQTSKVDRLKSAGSGVAPRVGSEAPDFTLTDLSGKQIKLSSLRGRPVMINFWATWCPPCRAEIPTLVQAYGETHKGNNYEILGVATQSDAPTITAFSKELGMNFPVLPDNDNRVSDLYHILPIPTSFFIDKDGIVRDIQIGIVDRPTLDKWLLSQ